MSYESVVLADSPTLLWMLQETSGTTAADATGNGHTGTYNTGCTLAQPGPSGVGSGKAVTFNDSATGNVYTNSTVSLSGAFSIECWYKTSASSDAIGGDGGSQGATGELRMIGTSSGNLFLNIYQETANLTTSGTNYADGNWHYVVATCDGSGNAVIYADGASKVSGAMGASPYSWSAYWQAGITNYSPYYSSGTMAAFATYPVVLTSTQVSNHYAAASGPAFTAPPNRPRGQAVNRASTY